MDAMTTLLDKKAGRNHVFLSNSGLLWTILDFLMVKGRPNHKVQSTGIKDKSDRPLCKYRFKYRRQVFVVSLLKLLRKKFLISSLSTGNKIY